MTMKSIGRSGAIATAVALVSVGVLWVRSMRKHATSASRDAGTDGAQSGDHAAAAQSIELAQACDALASSAPADVVKHWVAAYRATRNALEREAWIRDRFAWMDLHKVETTLATCGIRGAQAIGIIGVLAKDEDYGRYVREERDSICTFGQKLAVATSGATAWHEDVSILWNAACVRLLSGAAAGGSAPGASPREAPAAAPGATSVGSCTGLDALSTQHAGMVSRSLDAEAWIAYGRTLAACGPDTNPWGALHLERGREQFVDEYVAPFLNGDAASGSPFQKQASDLYERIVTAWGFGDG